MLLLSYNKKPRSDLNLLFQPQEPGTYIRPCSNLHICCLKFFGFSGLFYLNIIAKQIGPNDM